MFRFVFWFSIMPIISFAQVNADVLIKSFDWKDWDHFDKDTTAKAEYLALFHHYSDSILSPQYHEGSLDAFKFIDLDGDTYPDLIIDGHQIKGHAEQMLFYLLKNDSIVKIYSTTQYISKIERTYPNGPVYFEAVQDECCQDDEYELTTFNPYLSNHNLLFRPTRIEIRRKDSDYVSQRFPPVGVMVKTSKTPLLLAPASKDIVKYYAVGSIGYACASKVDEQGRIWWQVFMAEEKLKLRLGWIQKSHLSRNPGK